MPDEEPVAPVALAPGLDHVAALSSRGRLLVFPLAEMREVPRGRGVIVIGLDGEEKLVADRPRDGDARSCCKARTASAAPLRRALEGEALAKHLHRRARKGSLRRAKAQGHRFRARRLNGGPPAAPQATTACGSRYCCRKVSNGMRSAASMRCCSSTLVRASAASRVSASGDSGSASIASR